MTCRRAVTIRKRRDGHAGLGMTPGAPLRDRPCCGSAKVERVPQISEFVLWGLRDVFTLNVTRVVGAFAPLSIEHMNQKGRTGCCRKKRAARAEVQTAADYDKQENEKADSERDPFDFSSHPPPPIRAWAWVSATRAAGFLAFWWLCGRSSLRVRSSPMRRLIP